MKRSQFFATIIGLITAGCSGLGFSRKPPAPTINGERMDEGNYVFLCDGRIYTYENNLLVKVGRSF